MKIRIFKKIYSYLQVVKLSFMNAVTYRPEVFLWLLLDSFPMLILLVIWGSMYQGQTEVASYSLNQIIEYYMLAAIIDGIVSTHFESWRVQTIREGKVDFYLTRPLDYLTDIFLRDLGGKLSYVLMALPFSLLVYSLIVTFTSAQFPSFTWYQAIVFALFLIISYIVEFWIGTLIVMLGFWFEYAEGLEQFKWLVISLLSGWMVPIAMMPPLLKKVVEALPFKYIYAVPIAVVQNGYRVSIWDWSYVIGFSIFLGILTRIIWRFARRAYSSQGG